MTEYADNTKIEHETPQGIVIHHVTVDNWSGTQHNFYPVGVGGVDVRYGRSIRVSIPELGDNAATLAEGCTITLPRYTDYSAEVARHWAEAIRVAADFADEQNEQLKDHIEAARVREERERQRREREKAEREAKLEARNTQLLHELLGEHGRIRLEGYKRMRPVTVTSVETTDGTFYARFEYKKKERHGYRDVRVDQVKTFEVKVGSRYKTVWDDGMDDLPEWDRPSRSHTPEQWDGRLP